MEERIPSRVAARMIGIKTQTLAKWRYRAEVLSIGFTSRRPSSRIRCEASAAFIAGCDAHGHRWTLTRIRRTFALAKQIAGITRRFRIHDLATRRRRWPSGTRDHRTRRPARSRERSIAMRWTQRRIGSLSPRERGAATPHRGRVPHREPGAGAPVLPADVEAQPELLPGTERHHVRAHARKRHRRSGRYVGDASSRRVLRSSKGGGSSSSIGASRIPR